MRRKDREVTDFKKIVSIIDKCEIIRIGLADGDFPWSRDSLNRCAIVKISVNEITAKVNPVQGGAD